MFEKMDMALLCARAKWNSFVNRLFPEEKGAADIVAILVIIVIVLAVAAIFREQLIGLVQKVFGKATTWVEQN